MPLLIVAVRCCEALGEEEEEENMKCWKVNVSQRRDTRLNGIRLDPSAAPSTATVSYVLCRRYHHPFLNHTHLRQSLYTASLHHSKTAMAGSEVPLSLSSLPTGFRWHVPFGTMGPSTLILAHASSRVTTLWAYHVVRCE